MACLREAKRSGIIPGGGGRINVFADVLDRELSFTRLKVKRLEAYKWRLRMGLGVKGFLRIFRVDEDLHYEILLKLSRLPLLLSVTIAAFSLLLSIVFLFFGFLFLFFLFPLVIGLWNVEKAEIDVLNAIEAAQIRVFGEVLPSTIKANLCPVCGFKPPNWAIYCPRCGTKL